jgi:hypothetical protein
MANVKKTQEASKLGSLEDYLDELKRIASVLEEKRANMDEIQKETVDAINSVVSSKKEAILLSNSLTFFLLLLLL